MLRKRLVTVLTFCDGVLFRTKLFQPDYRYTLNFVDAWSVDEIVVLDVTRPGQGKRANFFAVVERFARNCFVPLAAGGGVRTREDVKTFLAMGADKVVINTQAARRPEFLTEIASLYGAQCVVHSIDAKKEGEGYQVYIDQGREPTGLDPASWARRGQELGAGEVLITSMDRDGWLQGYDLELCRRVAESVSVPVLVLGGAGNWSHFVQAIEQAGASAVCTQNIHHFSEASIKSAKLFMAGKGLPVRV